MKKLLSLSIVLLLFVSFVSCQKNEGVTSETQTTTADGSVFMVDVDKIPSGEVVCVGSLDIKKNHTLEYDVSVENGNGIMVGVTQDSDIKKVAEGTLWGYGDSSEGNEIKETHLVDLFTGHYYIYVGSTTEDIENVTGTIKYK